MADHATCRDAVKQALAKACANVGEPDMDLVVSTVPPILAPGPGRWEPIQATCEHGITYWIEPTGEQRAKWMAEEVR